MASLPGVQYGALYYRYLEMDKIAALKNAKGNFDAPMCISKGRALKSYIGGLTILMKVLRIF